VLLQLLFWYKAVLAILPSARQAIPLPFGSNLSIRGLLLPAPVPGDQFYITALAFLGGLIVAILIPICARRRQMATGKQFPSFLVGLGVIIVATAGAFMATGRPLSFEFPELKGFNFVGGFGVKPELLALLLGLVLLVLLVWAALTMRNNGRRQAPQDVAVLTWSVPSAAGVPVELNEIVPALARCA